jgi:hypothetical protein
MTTLTMSRPIKRPETTERHTAESIDHVASELEKLVNVLRTSAAMLSGTPKLGDVELRYERSMRDGIKFLKLWAGEVQTKISDARLDAMKQAKK